MSIQLELTWAPVKPNSLIKAENRPGSDSSKHQSPADIFFLFFFQKSKTRQNSIFLFPFLTKFFGALTDRGKKSRKMWEKKGEMAAGRGKVAKCPAELRENLQADIFTR